MVLYVSMIPTCPASECLLKIVYLGLVGEGLSDSDQVYCERRWDCWGVGGHKSFVRRTRPDIGRWYKYECKTKRFSAANKARVMSEPALGVSSRLVSGFADRCWLGSLAV